MSEAPDTYQCPECGLHYDNQLTVAACENWCKKHKSCHMEIAKYSIERKARAKSRNKL